MYVAVMAFNAKMQTMRVFYRPHRQLQVPVSCPLYFTLLQLDTLLPVHVKVNSLVWYDHYHDTISFFLQSVMFTNRNQSLLSEIDKSVITLKTDEYVDLSKEDSFLLVYQTMKQKEWLERYGNIITCMDGVYKTQIWISLLLPCCQNFHWNWKSCWHYHSPI